MASSMAKALSSASRSSCSARMRGRLLSFSYPRIAVTTGSQRDRHEPGAARDCARGDGKQLGEGKWLRASQVVGAADGSRALCRREDGFGQVGHMDGLLEPISAARHGKHRSFPQYGQQPRQVPVAGRAVNHRGAHDGPVELRITDALLRGESYSL